MTGDLDRNPQRVRTFGATNITTIDLGGGIVPERDVTDEDHADFEQRFKAQQLKSQADAQSAKPKEPTT